MTEPEQPNPDPGFDPGVQEPAGVAESVVVAGATGLVGRALCSRLAECGYDVVALVRDPNRAAALFPGPVSLLQWEPDVDGPWQAKVAGADVVVNLVGEPIAPLRWSDARKRILRSSRIATTKRIVTAMAEGAPGPRVLVNASATGIYGDRSSEPLTETSKPGQGFLPQLCVDWEAEARTAGTDARRVVLARLGMVLAGDGGALPRMVAPMRKLIGVVLGSGKQWVPWVHLTDAVEALMICIHPEGPTGPVNVVSPAPSTMRDVSAAIGARIDRPVRAGVPAFALRATLGEMAGVLLESQRVLPEALQAVGFEWEYPVVARAVADLVKR
jgi:uncharacterized protein (TIGR01777 family)